MRGIAGVLSYILLGIFDKCYVAGVMVGDLVLVTS